MMHNSTNYQLVTGMEIHAELKTTSKMFCGCKNDPFGAPEPNIYTCPVCLGMPGALPIANKKAIEWTVKLGLALGCKINLFSKFDRKHYFYPDLPKGYQISQYDLPFCYEGIVETSFGPVRIRRIHLEEDTGKLLHKTVDGEKVSLIDFNRSSVPLIEIVTEPDIKSPEQAKEYAKKIRQILRHLDIADCDMEQGGMRLEANISLRSADTDQLPGYKVEVKNINSFRFLEQAIAWEMQRQALQLMEGETPRQETRGWDAENNVTFPQRTKEEAEDYRYFPDPDIPPIHLTEKMLDDIRAVLPELPDQIVQRWQDTFAVEPRFGSQLVEEKKTADHYDAIFAAAKAEGVDVNKLASMIVNHKLTVDHTANPSDVVSHFKELTAVESLSADDVLPLIEQVMTDNPDEVAAYKSGKTQLLNFFVGQTMKKLGRKVDMAELRQLIQKRLES